MNNITTMKNIMSDAEMLLIWRLKDLHTKEFEDPVELSYFMHRRPLRSNATVYYIPGSDPASSSSDLGEFIKSPRIPVQIQDTSTGKFFSEFHKNTQKKLKASVVSKRTESYLDGLRLFPQSESDEDKGPEVDDQTPEEQEVEEEEELEEYNVEADEVKFNFNPPAVAYPKY